MRAAVLLLAAAAAAVGCSRPAESMDGTVAEVTTNTLTILTASQEVVTFETSEAVRDCAGGLFAGSPVRVSFAEAPRDGFGTAVKIAAPAEYNLLIGTWMQPNPIDASQCQGFSLYPCGEAESVNMRTLLYDGWSVSGRELTLSGRSEGNGVAIGFSEVWTIERLDAERLTIRSGECIESYTRADREGQALPR